MAISLVGFYAIPPKRGKCLWKIPSSTDNGKKKHWTVEEKVQIVRRYLKDHVGLADLAEETGSIPGLILQWSKQPLEGIEQKFSKEIYQQGKVLHREIQEKGMTGSGNGNRSPRSSPPRTFCNVWSLAKIQAVS